jgi:hypothetical protein
VKNAVLSLLSGLSKPVSSDVIVDSPLDVTETEEVGDETNDQ